MRLHHVFVCLLLRFELTSSWIPGNFIFTTCQGGAERALKEEMAREYPTLNFAFSRPGLVTWKCPTAASPDVEIRSIFARCYGVSLGMAATFEDVYSIALDVSKTLDTNVLLHVFPR
jgi:23S rRNA (cytidine2498-2'-O)-methyltransferase